MSREEAQESRIVRFVKPSLIKIQINMKELAFFKYIFESYENLATIRTLNQENGIIEIYIPKGNLSTVENLLENMKNEVRFVILEKEKFHSDPSL